MVLPSGFLQSFTQASNYQHIWFRYSRSDISSITYRQNILFGIFHAEHEVIKGFDVNKPFCLLLTTWCDRVSNNAAGNKAYSGLDKNSLAKYQ